MGFFLCLFAMPLCASVYMCLVVTCWEKAGLWLSFVVSNCEFVTFPLVSPGQVWYLIVSILDLCILTYFVQLMRIGKWVKATGGHFGGFKHLNFNIFWVSF